MAMNDDDDLPPAKLEDVNGSFASALGQVVGAILAISPFIAAAGVIGYLLIRLLR